MPEIVARATLIVKYTGIAKFPAVTRDNQYGNAKRDSGRTD